MKRNGTLVYLAAMAAVMAVGLVARADSVTVSATFQPLSTDKYVPVTITSNYNDSSTGTSSSPTANTLAGVYNFKVNDVVDSTGTSGALPSPLTFAQVDALLPTNAIFQGVCIDFAHNIGEGWSKSWYVTDLSQMPLTGNGVGITATQQNAIYYLWNKYNPGHSVGVANTNSNAARFQLAVWDVLYDSTNSQASPLPYVTYSGQAVTTGDVGVAYEMAADAMHAAAQTASVYALVNTDQSTQSFSIAIVGATGHLNTTPVPLPAAVGIGFSMLAGFGAMFGLRKRLARRPRIA